VIDEVLTCDKAQAASNKTMMKALGVLFMCLLLKCGFYFAGRAPEWECPLALMSDGAV